MKKLTIGELLCLKMLSRKNFFIRELHCIPFSAHPGMNRTVAKVQKHFFWRGMTNQVRDFLESCPICQTEKCDHTLSK